jgi:hypothetical protein
MSGILPLQDGFYPKYDLATWTTNPQLKSVVPSAGVEYHHWGHKDLPAMLLGQLGRPTAWCKGVGWFRFSDAIQAVLRR